ncbi:MAG: hypothetical protein JNG85_16400 [Spirochaetaceae bacterium]|nr:hypothetical protein [Spirochaetaceae bacterium]
MNLVQYVPTILDILTPILVAALTYASARAVAFINAKVKSENLRTALLKVDEAVVTTVKALQQTTVTSLKDATKDGVFTAEEAAKVKAEAMQLVLSQLGSLEAIGKQLGMAEVERIKALIDAKIEAAVFDTRRSFGEALLFEAGETVEPEAQR